MPTVALTPDEYASQVKAEHQPAFDLLRKTIKESLPAGFEECMNYGMIGFVVPHSLYPSGYHVKPELPLPFINIASQKNFIGLYHMGIYAQPEIQEWFVDQYGKRVPSKLDMGKSCVRLKKPEQIPMDLITELCGKMTPQDWIGVYEKVVKG